MGVAGRASRERTAIGYSRRADKDRRLSGTLSFWARTSSRAGDGLAGHGWGLCGWRGKLEEREAGSV
jgi:hypothetical protein